MSMTLNTEPAADWTPIFNPWRHGGWYVSNVRYPSGAVGCVSRNYPDRKWRVVCSGESATYPTRDAAARAERCNATQRGLDELVDRGYRFYEIDGGRLDSQARFAAADPRNDVDGFYIESRRLEVCVDELAQHVRDQAAED